MKTSKSHKKSHKNAAWLQCTVLNSCDVAFKHRMIKSHEIRGLKKNARETSHDKITRKASYEKISHGIEKLHEKRRKFPSYLLVNLERRLLTGNVDRG